VSLTGQGEDAVHLRGRTTAGSAPHPHQAARAVGGCAVGVAPCLSCASFAAKHPTSHIYSISTTVDSSLLGVDQMRDGPLQSVKTYKQSCSEGRLPAAPCS